MTSAKYDTDPLNLSRKTSSATAENVKDYHNLINAARADLEDRLEGMDDKLELILGGRASVSANESKEVELIKQERLSTEKCLQICADLSDHIAQIELTARHASAPTPSAVTDHMPDRITSGGLQECRQSLAATAKRLQGYEGKLFARLLDKSSSVVASDQDRADLARLRDEWEATRQGIEICDRASEHLKDNFSTIDNYAVGDAVQFMVSTDGKTIHGTNRGLGWRTRQVGGHIGEEALKEIAQSLTSLAVPVSGAAQESTAPATQGEQKTEAKEFSDQYGEGFTLSSRR